MLPHEISARLQLIKVTRCAFYLEVDYAVTKASWIPVFGDSIAAATVVWCAGLHANPLQTINCQKIYPLFPEISVKF